jgi:hypothetical protein
MVNTHEQLEQELHGLFTYFPMTDNIDNDKAAWVSNMQQLKQFTTFVPHSVNSSNSYSLQRRLCVDPEFSQSNIERWYNALDAKMKRITGHIMSTGDDNEFTDPNNK